MINSFLEYTKTVLSPFFKWWWALITGIATFAGYVLTSDSGVNVGRISILFGILIFFILIFLSVSVFIQGWQVFKNQNTEVKLVNIQKNSDLGGEFVFIFSSFKPLENGTLINIKRQLGDIEVPFAVVEIISMNKNGNPQGKEFSIKPAHLRDFNNGKCSIVDLTASPYIPSSQLKEAFHG
jgi:hypothetical protein